MEGILRKPEKLFPVIRTYRETKDPRVQEIRREEHCGLLEPCLRYKAREAFLPVLCGWG